MSEQSLGLVQDKATRMKELLEQRRTLQTKKDALLQQIHQIDEDMAAADLEYAAIHNSLVPAPILPQELLCLIFLYASESARWDEDARYASAHFGHWARAESGSVPQRELSPLVEVQISHVCHQWRTTAIQYARLWCYFEYDAMVSGSNSLPLPLFQLYLERSLPHPLELWLYFDNGKQVDPSVMDMIDLAIKHIGRWRFFSLTAVGNYLTVTGLHSLMAEKEAPYLEYLIWQTNFTFDLATRLRVAGPPSLPVLELAVPKLTHLHVDSTTSLFPRSFSNVTVLYIHRYEAEEQVRLTWSAFLELTALPALVAFSVAGSPFQTPAGQDWERRIKMRRLRHLRLAANAVFVQFFLYHLDAPALQTLVLSCMDFPSAPDSWTPQLSLPSLHTLYASHCDNLEEHYARLLIAASPNLEHLVIDPIWRIPRSLIDFVNEEYNAGRKPWMNLQKVTSRVFSPDLEPNPYIALVSPRSGGGTSFSLKLSPRLLNAWELEEPEKLLELQSLCNLSRCEVDELLPREWPPGDTLKIRYPWSPNYFWFQPSFY